ncbi:glycine--tRNA ligase subunit beta [Elioraea rosea]|uniref:glycine--tRNA ligase subunit beta n=1 Tax=Elioraea rosea TaxID=2492390 RepID=UPI001183D50A|nr:glycine--tRNA ligase subunit beta [Elioraea rosea]
MPELFLELFSEEIPARMQGRAAEEFARAVTEALGALNPREVRSFSGPRRIGLVVTAEAATEASASTERGPRTSAPEAALAGFLKKHGATKDALREEGGYWVLEKSAPPLSAASLVAETMPGIIRRFGWPKSMRWGGSSSFAWVRPLRRILCTLDGAVIAFSLAEGVDDGHGLVASNVTEGHRFLSPGAITVSGFEDYAAKLRDAKVIVDPAERRAAIVAGVEARAAEVGCTVAGDPGLFDEVAGLVEWPVPLLGRIDDAFMDLPDRVRQLTMRLNQKYFTLLTANGSAAPYFVVVANIEAKDGGRAIVAGNERVLRARLSDARFFWDQDRRQRLDSRLPRLEAVTFHARLGTQGARVLRLVRLAGILAPMLGADIAKAERAAMLAKADLVTGMVGEFPELQGYMGRRYAAHDGEDEAVALAIEQHYAPAGQGDAVPSAPVSVTVALADRLDTIAGFFAADERPTGSGDPFALRRAALGVIRLVRENELRLDLVVLLGEAVAAFAEPLGLDQARQAALVDGLYGFLIERLRVQLRAEGRRHDVIAATLGAQRDGDLVRLLARADALAALLGTEDGANLLTAHKRASNILRIEEKKDGRAYAEPPDAALLREPAETALAAALDAAEPAIGERLGREDFAGAMAEMGRLRAPVDAFFAAVTVNATETELRGNRLRLLSRIRAVTARAADFSLLEG